MGLFWGQSEKKQEPIVKQICRHAKRRISDDGSFNKTRSRYIAAVRATEVSACSLISPGQYTTTCTFMGIGNEANSYGWYKIADREYGKAIHLCAQQIDYLSELSKLNANELWFELGGLASGVTALVDLSGKLVQFSNKYRNSSNVQINSMHEPFKKFERPSNKR
ncbi:MAG: hypothetical protein M9962_00865 [Oligoflexia bacterium]|nr:hypothetical protein [Oligoflexia bacterium]